MRRLGKGRLKVPSNIQHERPTATGSRAMRNREPFNVRQRPLSDIAAGLAHPRLSEFAQVPLDVRSRFSSDIGISYAYNDSDFHLASGDDIQPGSGCHGIAEMSQARTGAFKVLMPLLRSRSGQRVPFARESESGVPWVSAKES